MKQFKNNLLLLLAAFIWGCAFVAQSVGMDYVGPFTFNSVRCLIGAAVLLPVIACLDKINRKKQAKNPQSKSDQPATCDESSSASASYGWRDKTLWIGGILCGLILGTASSLQQIGILYTTVGKAGFITALYIVLVPIVGIFLGKKSRAILWISVAISVVGLYLLCMNESFSISKGDLFVFLSAVVFTAHILVIDHFSPLVDGVRMSCIQFLVAGILCGIPMIFIEKPELSAILAAYLPILYAGVMSCGVAYTLQIVGQKKADPTIASLLLSLESVFSVLAGWVLLHQTLSIKELLGCVLMFVAIILAQLPEQNQ